MIIIVNGRYLDDLGVNRRILRYFCSISRLEKFRAVIVYVLDYNPHSSRSRKHWSACNQYIDIVKILFNQIKFIV